MSAHGASAKALLLRAYKDGLRSLRGDADSSLSYHGLHAEVDPTRAFGRMYAVLVDSDLRALWQHGKQRAKEQWREAYAAVAGSRSQADPAAAAEPSSSIRSGSTDAELEPLYGRDGVLRTTLMYLLASASRAFMTGANTTTVQGAHHLEAALSRPPGTPLITVCNHVASMDDPLVVSTVVPQQYFDQAASLRWTLCATDRCFHSSLLAPFFTAAKVLPVERGAGMFQPGLAAAEARLAAGDWVHLFPEGTRSRDGRMGPVRKGVGRLVASCEVAPLIVPFVHSGMEEVMPRGRLVPRVGKEVRVLVGEPIDVSDLLQAAQAGGSQDDDLYCAIADRVGAHMQVLKARLDGVELDQVALDTRRRAQATAEGLDLYDPVDNLGRREKLWERLKFKMQHRKWTTEGWSAAAGEQLARLSQALPTGWCEEQQQAQQQQEQGVHQQSHVGGAFAAFSISNSSSSSSGTGRLDVVSAAAAAAAGQRQAHQQSIAMMQLLQARV